MSADVRSLAEGQARFACLCNPAGRVLGLLLLQRTGAGFWALCARELSDSLAAELRRFVLRSRVDILSRTDLQVAGLPAAVETDTHENLIRVAPLSYRLLPAGDGVDDGLPTTASATWRIRELLQGIFWLGPDTAGQFLPQMLGMERLGALDFRKGCFPGQEVIARTRYLGKLKRRPLLCRPGEPVAPAVMESLELSAGEETASAVVIDSATDVSGSSLLALVVRADAAFRPTALAWSGRRIPVEWAGTPGTPPGGEDDGWPQGWATT